VQWWKPLSPTKAPKDQAGVLIVAKPAARRKATTS
jgi:hypothetical protein